MPKDRFEDAKPVHTEEELEQKTHTDNYYLFKEYKEKVLLPVLIHFTYALAFIFVVILVGFIMYLFDCPLIKPGVGAKLQDIVHAVLAWGIGLISQYGFNKWRESLK